VRIVPRIKSDGGGTITFFLALGAGRQMCRLATTFLTQKQAFSYLRKNRTEFERMARQGRLTPDAWIRGAVGGPISAQALLAASREALAKVRD
jgi:hypothetical protein